MSMHILYNPDGSIYACNQIYSDTRKFEQGLNDMGNTNHLTYDGIPGLVSGEKWYVDVVARETVVRPVMEVTVTKNVIQCGDQDSAILRGMPKNCRVKVFFQDTLVYPEFVLDAEELEISIPVPATYRIELAYWPYQTFYTLIQAVA